MSRRLVSGTQEGAFLRVLRTAVPFEEPDACAIIGNGAIVVAEFVGRRVQLLSRSGRLLQVFTGHASGSNGRNRAACGGGVLCLTPLAAQGASSRSASMKSAFRCGPKCCSYFRLGASR